MLKSPDQFYIVMIHLVDHAEWFTLECDAALAALSHGEALSGALALLGDRVDGFAVLEIGEARTDVTDTVARAVAANWRGDLPDILAPYAPTKPDDENISDAGFQHNEAKSSGHFS